MVPQQFRLQGRSTGRIGLKTAHRSFPWQLNGESLDVGSSSKPWLFAKRRKRPFATRICNARKPRVGTRLDPSSQQRQRALARVRSRSGFTRRSAMVLAISPRSEADLRWSHTEVHPDYPTFRLLSSMFHEPLLVMHRCGCTLRLPRPPRQWGTIAHLGLGRWSPMLPCSTPVWLPPRGFILHLDLDPLGGLSCKRRLERRTNRASIFVMEGAFVCRTSEMQLAADYAKSLS